MTMHAFEVAPPRACVYCEVATLQTHMFIYRSPANSKLRSNFDSQVKFGYHIITLISSSELICCVQYRILGHSNTRVW